MNGMLYFIKAIVSRISPVPLFAWPHDRIRSSAKCSCSRIGFQSYKTDSYKLHYLETASGVKFALLTDLSAPDMSEHLSNIFANVCGIEFLAMLSHRVPPLMKNCRCACFLIGC